MDKSVDLKLLDGWVGEYNSFSFTICAQPVASCTKLESVFDSFTIHEGKQTQTTTNVTPKHSWHHSSAPPTWLRANSTPARLATSFFRFCEQLRRFSPSVGSLARVTLGYSLSRQKFTDSSVSFGARIVSCCCVCSKKTTWATVKLLLMAS